MKIWMTAFNTLCLRVPGTIIEELIFVLLPTHCAVGYKSRSDIDVCIQEVMLRCKVIPSKITVALVLL